MRRPTILVVDDKENMRRLFQRMLEETYEVTTAADGAQALELLATTEFDIVLSDIRMPGASGFDVLMAVKVRTPLTPIVLMTAFTSGLSAIEALQGGAYDCVDKPFDPDEVMLILACALEPERLVEQTRDTLLPLLASVPYKDALCSVRNRAFHEYLTSLLNEFIGSVARAAEHAMMDVATLLRLLKRFGIQPATA